jgi:hypothetical protein
MPHKTFSTQGDYLPTSFGNTAHAGFVMGLEDCQQWIHNGE